MTTTTIVTPEMLANGTAPVLSFGRYPELREGETVDVSSHDEERLSTADFRKQYEALCFDEDGEPLPDDRINPVIPASTYITGTNSPRIRAEFNDEG